jgi:ribosome biogenesis GTPase / thiamine phosphate phosphatase
VEPRNVLRSFSDLDDLTEGCPRGCTHAASEPECALDTAVAEGRLSAERLASFRRIQVAGRTT